MASALRILHLEDDPADALWVDDALRAAGLNAVITAVADRPGFVAALAGGDFDLMLADYKLPAYDGLEALAQWRARWPDKPFVFVTGFMGEDLAVESLKRGATDYVLKENLARLVPAIHRAVAEADEQARRQRAEEALRRWEYVFNHAGWAVATADPRTDTLELVNPAFAAMHGYTVQEMIGMPLTELFTPDERKRLPQRNAEAHQQGDCVYESEHVRKDGAKFAVLTHVTAFKDNAGEVLFRAATFQDITSRKQAEEALKASLREKEVLLREVHHRVKNNLQIISSLVSLQADAFPDPALRELFQDVGCRVRTMALVHEKLYESESLAQVDFAEYARSLLDYLWRAHGSAAESIRLKLDLQPLTLPMDLALPCGLVLNELASNALKHAFYGRSQGEVTVALHIGPKGRVCLGVRDDGVGLAPGQDWRESRSLGLQLVQMLAGQLNATVELSRNPGTEFCLRFSPELPFSGAERSETLHQAH